MDWIKVKTNHVLYEYTDLSPTEFQAWVKIMALTAQLEHEPTREQMLRFVNYQTLNSLSSKLHQHSIDLSSILHKVLIDVSDVHHMREYWKNKKKQSREVKNDVHMEVKGVSTVREDKIREDKIINKRIYSPTSDEVRLSELLLSLIVARNPKHKLPNIQTWAKSIDKMIRLDERTPEEIEKLIKWVQADSFWRNNILSVDTLRKQYDRLILKMKGEENGSRNSGGTGKVAPKASGASSDDRPYPVDAEY